MCVPTELLHAALLALTRARCWQEWQGVKDDFYKTFSVNKHNIGALAFWGVALPVFFLVAGRVHQVCAATPTAWRPLTPCWHV